MRKDILSRYFKYIEDNYCCKISDELFGKKYIIKEQSGKGSLLRVNIEDGLEISKLIVSNEIDMDFDNRGFSANVLEVGYCYDGDAEIWMMPDNKKCRIRAGDVFIYKMLNNVDHFKFKYRKCKTISISMNFNVIKNAINPVWEGKLVVDWHKNLNNMSKGNILVVEEASYNIKKIANELDLIAVENMMGYMNLKLKTIEFFATLIGEKNNSNIAKDFRNKEVETTVKVKEIINNNLENTPSIKELADKMNISVYKLQKGFKNITGDTVYEYIKKARIEKAKELLKNTDMSILQITNEIGYENPSKFANLFKRYNDITPLKYRKIENKK